MGSIHKTTYFFHNKPLFGLDIGHGSLKVMQFDEKSLEAGNKPRMTGYGTASFDESAIDDGAIAKPEIIAESLLKLFKGHLIGDITTNRVAVAIPSYRTFSRSIILPNLSNKELDDAVRLEVEQYIPVPIDDLYLDYTPASIHNVKEDGTLELFAVAVPKKIVDSYLNLTEMAGLETVLIESTMGSAGRLLAQDNHDDMASMIIDFGSISADLSIYDKTILATGTVPAGGLTFTDAIQKKLDVSHAEAALIKTKYGLGMSKKQKEILNALEPTLQQVVKEIRRMIRYYTERYGSERPIGQVVTLGGGANMPGLSDYLTNALRLPVRTYDPWTYIDYKGLQPPAHVDKPMFATVAGLGLTNVRRIFSS
mgnify:CR=1 FL=1